MLGIKLVGRFIENLIFSEQSDHSCCLPKSRNLVIFVKSVPVGLIPVLGKAEYLKYKDGQEKTIVYLRGCNCQPRQRIEMRPRPVSEETDGGRARLGREIHVLTNAFQ